MPAGKACDLVTSDQIASATGHKIGPPRDATGDTLRNTCEWPFTDSGVGQPAYGAESGDTDGPAPSWSTMAAHGC